MLDKSVISWWKYCDDLKKMLRKAISYMESEGMEWYEIGQILDVSIAKMEDIMND